MIESERHGAPATMVRGGDDRDLAAIVAMDATRAAPFRFHLDSRSRLVHFAIAKKRLLAGLGPPGVREVQFFVAEEGASAVAYVVLTSNAGMQRVDARRMRRPRPAGARVGAILQALIARDPAEKRVRDHGVAAATASVRRRSRSSARTPSADVMMARALSDRAPGWRYRCAAKTCCSGTRRLTSES